MKIENSLSLISGALKKLTAKREEDNSVNNNRFKSNVWYLPKSNTKRDSTSVHRSSKKKSKERNFYWFFRRTSILGLFCLAVKQGVLSWGRDFLTSVRAKKWYGFDLRETAGLPQFINSAWKSRDHVVLHHSSPVLAIFLVREFHIPWWIVVLFYVCQITFLTPLQDFESSANLKRCGFLG